MTIGSERFRRVCAKVGILAGFTLIFSAADAFSRSGVSPKFDGVYAGAMTPAERLSASNCPAITVNAFEVRGGNIQAPTKVAETTDPVFDGFVTEEGFVTGHVRMGGSSKITFEGRIVADNGDELLSGGATDPETGCAWLVELRKAER